MLQLEALRKNIIFQFVEDVTDTRFVNSTASGLLVSSKDTNQTAIPRWVEVTHIGPDVDGIAVGDFALIEAGKWTPGFYVEEARYWKTDEDKVLALSDEPATTY